MAEDSIVLEILRGLQADLASVKADLASVKADLASVKTDVAALQRQGASHTRTLDVLRQDVRMIRAAVNDIARTDVTSGEVEALHHDLNRLQQDFADLTARVDLIEGRDGSSHR
jgi:chromosome segregation ATPase